MADAEKKVGQFGGLTPRDYTGTVLRRPLGIGMGARARYRK